MKMDTPAPLLEHAHGCLYGGAQHFACRAGGPRVYEKGGLMRQKDYKTGNALVALGAALLAALPKSTGAVTVPKSTLRPLLVRFAEALREEHPADDDDILQEMSERRFLPQLSTAVQRGWAYRYQTSLCDLWF